MDRSGNRGSEKTGEARLAVVGVGGIGQHHLFGLENLSFDKKIFAIDPSQQALENSRLQVEKRLGRPSGHFCSTNTAALPPDLDLAIIATTADVRASVIAELVKKCDIRSLLIEKPISSSASEVDRVLQTVGDLETAWVNYPRRISALHTLAKNEVTFSENFSASTKIYGQGLITNSFHIVDFFSWLFGARISQVTVRPANDGWHPSKRSGFFELLGTIEVEYEGGSSLSVSSGSHPKNENENVVIEISQNSKTLVLDERSATIRSQSFSKSIPGLQLQSVLTTSVADQIISSGCSDLTPLREAATNEKKMLDALLAAWPKEAGSQMKIT